MSPILALALAAAPVDAFDPVAFFRGRTEGQGQLKVIMKPTTKVRVESLGRQQADGSLLLEQVVREGAKPPRTRYWRLRSEGRGRYSGTLTDAVGPVRITTENGRIHIRYRSKDNLNFDQWLTPAGSRRVNNRMRIRRFGLTVARVEEVITKLD